MSERLNKPNDPPIDAHEQLTTSNLAKAGEEKGLDVENRLPVGKSGVKIEDANQGTSGQSDSALHQSSAAASFASNRGTAESAPMGGRGIATAAAPAREEAAPLFSPDESTAFRSRWDSIQVEFVDEPRRCVEQADHLVAETMKHLAEIFASERERLEHEWDRGGDVSTEDLRQALRRYRSFFGRLLSV